MEQLELIPKEPDPTLEEACSKLEELVGKDLKPLADQYHITVHHQNHRNKGWAGQTVERYLGKWPDSAQEKDFKDFELKVIPIALSQKGHPLIRETMAITMLNEKDLETPFEESHLYQKMSRLLLCARTIEGEDDQRSLVLCAIPFELSGEFKDQLKKDYESIRAFVEREGFYALHTGLGDLVQVRPKGVGPNGRGFAFYLRKKALAGILGLGPEASADEE